MKIEMHEDYFDVGGYIKVSYARGEFIVVDKYKVGVRNILVTERPWKRFKWFQIPWYNIKDTWKKYARKIN